MPTPQSPSAAGASGSASTFASLIEESTEATASREPPRLPIKPNFPFFLYHWPTEWSVQEEGLEGPTWLPVLAKHEHRPGINLNRTLKKDEPPQAAYDRQVVAEMRRGATYLEIGDYRTKLPNGTTYRRQAKCQDPKSKLRGVRYFEAFQVPRDKVPGRKLKFQFDRAAYNQWLLRLVRLGVIAPPVPAIRDERIRQVAARLDRFRGLRGVDDSERKRLIKGAESELKKWATAHVPSLDPEFLASVQSEIQ